MKKGFLGVIVVLAILLGVQSTSHALTLGFNDFVSPVFYVTDNQAGVDINPLVGVITYSGPIGNWIVNVTTGLSKPVIGTAGAPQIDLNSVNVTTTLAGHLRFGMVDSGFTGPISGGSAGPFTFAVGGTTQGTVFFDAFGEDANTEGFTGSIFANLGPFISGAFSGTTQGGFNATSPFSLGIIGDITHVGAGSTSFNASLSVPEASALILLGSGLIGLVGLRRKFKK